MRSRAFYLVRPLRRPPGLSSPGLRPPPVPAGGVICRRTSGPAGATSEKSLRAIVPLWPRPKPLFRPRRCPRRRRRRRRWLSVSPSPPFFGVGVHRSSGRRPRWPWGWLSSHCPSAITLPSGRPRRRRRRRRRRGGRAFKILWVRTIRNSRRGLRDLRPKNFSSIAGVVSSDLAEGVVVKFFVGRITD